jgi:hypothetical protein
MVSTALNKSQNTISDYQDAKIFRNACAGFAQRPVQRDGETS